MAGDDVDKKKPDPSIYRIAAQRLGVGPRSVPGRGGQRHRPAGTWCLTHEGMLWVARR